MLFYDYNAGLVPMDNHRRLINLSNYTIDRLRFLQSTDQRVFVTKAWNFGEIQDIIQEYKAVYQSASHCIIFLPEPNACMWDIILEFDRPHTTIFIGGTIGKDWAKHATVIYWPQWMHLVTEFHTCENMRPDWLEDYFANPIKDKIAFDILLGRNDPSRDRIHFEYLNRFGHKQNNNIYRYQGNTNPDDKFTVDDVELYTPEYIRDTLQTGTSSDTIPVNTISGEKINYMLSCIIDRGIYSKTNCTLISETTVVQERLDTVKFFGEPETVFFFTEKLGKPILAKRLFLMLNRAPGGLKELQRLGFKTFDNIIDESYDSEKVYFNRIQGALDQMEYLMNHPDPEQLLEKIEPIVEHNREHLIGLFKSMDDCIKQALERKDFNTLQKITQPTNQKIAQTASWAARKRSI